MNFFDELFEIINESDISTKFNKFQIFYDKFKANEDINLKRNSPAQELKTPCYASFCDVVSMKKFNKKTKPKDKKLAFIHSVAHIEFSAIDIALDACYRFDNLPRTYYLDWLEVAQDEIRHFNMIENLLKEQGAKYGDLSVHDGLFIALCKTQESLVKRMALLPRYMEANGLDANAHIIQKLQKEGGDKELIGALNVILQEEISHVSKGDKWFKFACKQLNINPSEYINIIQTFYPNSFKTSRELNEADRLKAGFSKEELEMIKNLQKSQNA
ncbi:ferritin-like domain-containing protein [Campylobacter sp. RM13119]|uniref:ferritin-like domain-containing protein n=1 Tax=Campylobacter californiensis TaxID=1032243 RepID=UPI0014761042|nr:ferritin-like domain-containing protein [Campylobacter sp. RM13119]MBE3605561.1 ferritin-like domain-containing protein [Campylobacter sp. RM13119]